MSIKEYITRTLAELEGVITDKVEFDIGLSEFSGSGCMGVNDKSTNRIRFTVRLQKAVK